MSEDREQFGVSMEEQLSQWREKVDQAEQQAQDKGPEFAEKLRPEFEAVTQRYEEARYKLTLLRMSGQEAWEELRNGFERAFDEFKASLDKALSRF